MRVCFVYPDIGGVEHYGTLKFYHGIGYLSSVLKQAGHETSLIYLQKEPTREAFLADIQARKPDLVAFSSTTHQHPFVEQCAAWLKAARPELFLVSGGVHPTLVPEQAIANESLDAVCVGEGEYALLDLVNALMTGRSALHILNLWVRDRKSGEIVRNAMRPLVTNLDVLPFPDRELFGYEAILAQNDGQADMMAGRGCPYNCSYCCNPALKKRYKDLGKYVRFRGVSNLLAEIRQLLARYHITSLNFQDDTFTLDRHWTEEFCRAYAAEFADAGRPSAAGSAALPFWINTRVERLDEDLIKLLARSGCKGVRIGVESGNEWLRGKVLKRQMSNDDFRRVFRLLHRYGIQTYTCNMIGLPEETPQMIEETIALNRELAPTKFQFSVFYPYPMTELYDASVSKGYLKEASALTGYYARESTLNLPTLPAEHLARGYDRFEELRSELLLMQQSRWKYRLYRLLSLLHGGDAVKLRRRIDAARQRLGFLRRRKKQQPGGGS
jgi:anaerobic magnesium-protoporphyrin IX monomethyl ester cyclase